MDEQELKEKTDLELINLFVAGSSAAFEVLVARHHRRAYQIAYGILNSVEDAEEVAQDTFVRIHRALPGFRGEAEFTTWMYRIVQNLARNKYRWNKVRGSQVSVSIDSPYENEEDSNRKMDLPDRKSSPSDEVSTAELKRIMSEELENLPEHYRQVLMLRNVENMSYEMIAELLDCKLGTIKSRISRAREELRQRLERF